MKATLEQRRIRLRTGWMRLGLATAALVFMPIVQPRAEYRWVLLLFLAYAIGFQIVLWKDVGGTERGAIAGIADFSMITFVMHRLGSLSASLVALYVFVGMLYALAVSLRMAQFVAVVASSIYLGVLWAETRGVLPYAPDAPSWSHPPPPHTANVLALTISLPLLFLASVTLVGTLLRELRDRETKLQQLSERDALTDLANRRYLLERCEIELARVGRGHPLVAVMVDLDGFKRVNDVRGHLKGDELLVSVAAALRAVTRKVDVVGRYGGDEFLLLLPDTTLDDAHNVVTRLLEAVREVGARFDPENHITASVGLTEARPDEDVTSLLRRADERAYAAKRDGGNRAAA